MIDIFDFIPSSEHAAIAAQTSAYVCDAPLASAIAALPAAGGRVAFGAGRFKFADTINLKKTVTLEGVGVGADIRSTLLAFPANKNGIVVNRWNTLGDGVEAVSTGVGDGSIIRNLAVIGALGTSGHGIRMRAPGVVADVNVSGFAGDAINIVAEHTSSDPSRVGNANGWSVDRVRATGCGGSALRVDGGDSNAGQSNLLNAADCGGWAIWDSSAGCTHVAPQADNCALGAYFIEGVWNQGVVLGCYAEGDMPASVLGPYVTMIPGQHAAPITGGSVMRAGQITGLTSTKTQQSYWGSRAVTAAFHAVPGVGFSLAAAGDGDHGVNWRWHEGSKAYQLGHGMLDARVMLTVTTEMSVHKDADGNPIPPGELIFEKPYWVPIGMGRYKRVSL